MKREQQLRNLRKMQQRKTCVADGSVEETALFSNSCRGAVTQKPLQELYIKLINCLYKWNGSF